MTDTRLRQSLLRFAGLLCAAVMLLFGYVISAGGYRVVSKWREISGPYAAIAILWVVAGVVMLTAALGILASRGRQPLPLWAGGAGAAAAGVSLIVGVLTYVIPCAGPS